MLYIGLSGHCVDFFHVLFGYWCRHGKWARTNRDYVLLVYGHWVLRVGHVDDPNGVF
jgi:hypothetical protein